jgi:hypothetical protein
MTDLQIKQGVAKAATKLSRQRLMEKAKSFDHIDIPFIALRYREEPDEISKKRLRFYLDLIETWYPLWSRTDNNTKAEFISTIFKCVCSAEDLAKLKTFKEIIHKKVITANNENVKIISRLRWRGKENHYRNYIHSQT